MTGLTAIIMAANTLHSIGERRHRSEKRDVGASIQGRLTEQIKAIRRHFLRGNRRHCMEERLRDSNLGTRGWDAINALSPIARCAKGGAAQPRWPLQVAQIRPILARLWRRANVSDRRFASIE
ncbi:hypothetical protein [Bradyrhizobium stylosanthis]|uniref:hypothetical protein n=1 Tax=Bradyrhizobium stylosanthis TaxID=1803665 RepID=UPI0012E829BE|nr:hypothetical protein [Bradyrhizobium stylosanthis]